MPDDATMFKDAAMVGDIADCVGLWTTTPLSCGLEDIMAIREKVNIEMWDMA